MAIAAPLFYLPVIQIITWVILLATLVVEAVAFVNCLLQRQDAFPAIGTFSKMGWLGILGLCILFSLFRLSMLFGILGGMIDLVVMAFPLVYLLDIRPALRDASDGRGSW